MSHDGNGAMCAVGWINAVYDLDYESNRELFTKIIGEPLVTPWNDNPVQTFANVLNAFKAADL